MMIERAASFGRSGNLVGVVSEPDAPTSPTSADILILNTGLNHKVGTFRMSVDLARGLAARGFRVLRFDLSGLGDSRMRVARANNEDMPVADTRDAMDFLGERYGAKRFVLMGLCSGSDNSHRVSVVDERVVGSVHLDGLGYRTPKYYRLYYGRRFLSPTFLMQQARKRMNEVALDPSPTIVNAFDRKFPPIELITRDFATLMSRGVQLLYIYNDGARLYTNYPEQLRDSFPTIDFGDRLEVDVNRWTEHTYPLVRGREAAIGRIAEWTTRRFGR